MMTTPIEKTSGVAQRWLGTRLLSFSALAAALCGVGYAARATYHIATDAFVAPIVLSPDSDLVIQSKLSLSALMAERMRVASKKASTETELEAARSAIERLETLQWQASNALVWASTVSAKQAHAGESDLLALRRQKSVIGKMVEDQEDFVRKLESDLAAGLVQKSDLAREEHSLNQMRVAAIENERATIVTSMQTSQALLAHEALTKKRPGAIAPPEMLMQQDLLVRVQCDLIKLEAEVRTKSAEQKSMEEELSKIDDLVAQLKARPVFRATEANTNVVFVPYTQIDGVAAGASIYDCFWGAVACERVGRVQELLPGEVIVPDPWGTPARGQYAIIDLTEQHAAQSRTLRVRPARSTGIGQLGRVAAK